MRLAVAVVAALVFTTSGLSASKPRKPPAWMWTPQTAVQHVRALDVDPFNEVPGTLTLTRCAGKGKHRGTSYAAFVCAGSFKPASITDTTVRPVTLYVNVRRVGRGEPCVSMTSTVPSSCTNPKGAREPGDKTHAKIALTKALGSQGPNDCATWGLGYYRCWFGANASDDPSNGWATVIMLKTGPAVTVTKAFVKP